MQLLTPALSGGTKKRGRKQSSNSGGGGADDDNGGGGGGGRGPGGLKQLLWRTTNEQCSKKMNLNADDVYSWFGGKLSLVDDDDSDYESDEEEEEGSVSSGGSDNDHVNGGNSNGGNSNSDSVGNSSSSGNSKSSGNSSSSGNSKKTAVRASALSNKRNVSNNSMPKCDFISVLLRGLSPRLALPAVAAVGDSGAGVKNKLNVSIIIFLHDWI